MKINQRHLLPECGPVRILLVLTLTALATGCGGGASGFSSGAGIAYPRVVVQPDTVTPIPFAPRSPLGRGDSVFVVAAASGATLPVDAADAASGEVSWDTTGLAPGAYQLVVEQRVHNRGVVREPVGATMHVFGLAGDGLPADPVAPDEPGALATKFGFPSGAGTFEVRVDADGDPETTADQLLVASGGATDGTTSVELDPSSLACGLPYTVLLRGTDDVFGVSIETVVPGTLEVGPTGQLEAFNVTADGTAARVDFAYRYCTPVVVCTVHYSANVAPVVARVSDVTSTGFLLRLQNPSGEAVLSETVSVLVVEAGVWTIDGLEIEAYRYESTVVDENNSWVGESRPLGHSYVQPVVLGQVMSENDSLWSVFWCQGGSRTSPPTATALVTGKTVCEDSVVARAAETVGYVVFEAAHTMLGGSVELEAGLGADTIRGVGDAPPDTVTFGAAFTSAPEVVLATMAGVDGGNGGWAQVHGTSPATTTTLFLSIDEDQVGDGERNHTTEQVGYIAFARAFAWR